MNRRLNNWIRYFLENWIPPAIHDSVAFMWLPMRMAFGPDFWRYMCFKKDVLKMPEEEFKSVYKALKVGSFLQRPTDLNDECLKLILEDVRAFDTVLDVGCGRGYLVGELARSGRSVSGVDVYVDPKVKAMYSGVTFYEGDIETLQFPTSSFDVVVTTHTLEHVKDFHRAVQEVRRVARKLLIIVVPKERPYRYTPNLHLHFFPYVETFLLTVKPETDQYVCAELGGDIYYKENREARMNPTTAPGL